MRYLKALKVFALTAHFFKRSLKKDECIDLLKMNWATKLGAIFNLHIETKGIPASANRPCIFIGNHVSYLDIPVLMQLIPSITFVSKNEVKYWPVIGRAAQRVNTIFVKRNRKASRGDAKKLIADTLKKNNQQVAIFPSGTTSIQYSSFWKKGVFEIAKEHDIEIQPFRIRYEPLHKVAYVGNDTFFFHMLELLKIPRVNVYLEFHTPVFIKEVNESCLKWKEWCEEII